VSGAGRIKMFFQSTLSSLAARVADIRGMGKSVTYLLLIIGAVAGTMQAVAAAFEATAGIRTEMGV